MRRFLTILVPVIIVGGILFAIFFPVFTGLRHPSLAEEQQQQRETVAKRVQSIGGWDSLHRQCDLLLRNTPFSNDYWSRNGSILPASIAVLRPQEVRVYPVYAAPSDPPRVVEIRFYGMHRTGGHDTPYYAVWVWGSSTPPTYTPALQDYQGQSGVGATRLRMKKLAVGVYEVCYS